VVSHAEARHERLLSSAGSANERIARVISHEGITRKRIDSDGFDIGRRRKLKPRPGRGGRFPFGRSGWMAIFNVMPGSLASATGAPTQACEAIHHACVEFTAKSARRFTYGDCLLRARSEHESGLKA
jgi:hypothetical protein